MENKATRVRIVRCPKCHHLLKEEAHIPLYRCGNCGVILQAKHYNDGGSKSETLGRNKNVKTISFVGNFAESPSKEDPEGKNEHELGSVDNGKVSLVKPIVHVESEFREHDLHDSTNIETVSSCHSAIMDNVSSESLEKNPRETSECEPTSKTKTSTRDNEKDPTENIDSEVVCSLNFKGTVFTTFRETNLNEKEGHDFCSVDEQKVFSYDVLSNINQEKEQFESRGSENKVSYSEDNTGEVLPYEDCSGMDNGALKPSDFCSVDEQKVFSYDVLSNINQEKEQFESRESENKVSYSEDNTGEVLPYEDCSGMDNGALKPSKEDSVQNNVTDLDSKVGASILSSKADPLDGISSILDKHVQHVEYGNLGTSSSLANRDNSNLSSSFKLHCQQQKKSLEHEEQKDVSSIACNQMLQGDLVDEQKETSLEDTSRDQSALKSFIAENCCAFDDNGSCGNNNNASDCVQNLNVSEKILLAPSEEDTGKIAYLEYIDNCNKFEGSQQEVRSTSLENINLNIIDYVGCYKNKRSNSAQRDGCIEGSSRQQYRTVTLENYYNEYPSHSNYVRDIIEHSPNSCRTENRVCVETQRFRELTEFSINEDKNRPYCNYISDLEVRSSNESNFHPPLHGFYGSRVIGSRMSPFPQLPLFSSASCHGSYFLHCHCLNCHSVNSKIPSNFQTQFFSNERQYNTYPGQTCCHLNMTGKNNLGLHYFHERTPDQFNETHASESSHYKEKHLPLRHLFQPIAGGAPFIMCDHCMELLQLPQNSMISRSQCTKIRCGSCSSVHTYSFDKSSHIIHDNPSPEESSYRNKSSFGVSDLHRPSVSSDQGSFQSKVPCSNDHGPFFYKSFSGNNRVLPPFSVSQNHAIGRAYASTSSKIALNDGRDKSILGNSSINQREISNYSKSSSEGLQSLKGKEKGVTMKGAPLHKLMGYLSVDEVTTGSGISPNEV